MDPVEDARALAGERFPGALAAFLGSSVLSPGGPQPSDLDIVIILAGLLRELRDADPDLAARMVAAIGDPAALTAAADLVLARAGGRLWAGLKLTSTGS